LTAADLTSLWPLIIPPVGAVVVMLVLAFYRNHALTAVLTLVSLGASIMMIPVSISAGARSVGSLLIMDGYAFFFIGLIFSAAFIVTLLSYSYLEKRKGYREEFYILLLLAATGSAVLPASNHFAAFFLGLEILSLSLYVLIAYSREGANGLEAGVKYLILAAVSTAFLLFGMALIYADLGSLGFSQNEFYQTLENRQRLLPLVGLGMILVGAGFKLAVVPFHLWTPDVYQGAPAPVTAFVATVSKGSVFALLFRYFALNSAHAGVLPNEAIRWTLALIAILSMFAGNLLALMQNNVKRILAYSSIAHLGYLLVALLAAMRLVRRGGWRKLR